MSRYIDADALIADMQERYCKPCQERKEDYNGVRCRACWVDDAIDDADGFADNSIDIVRCAECKYEPICSHSVQHTTHEPTSVTIGYKSVEWCSHGERKDQ